MKTKYKFQPIDKNILCYHRATETECLGDDSLPYHRHDAYEIYLFLSGNTNMYLEQACYHLNPGDLIVISPDEMHRSICLDNQLYERIGINIKKSMFEYLSTQRSNLLSCFEGHPHGINNLVHLSEEQLNYYISLTEKLIETLDSNDYGQDILANTYLSQILVFINTLYQTSTQVYVNIMPELVRNTMAYIEEHLTEDITLAQLSQKFCFNGAYISYKFKQHTGLTLRSYILDKKIALAKHLLADGKNVSEACYMSGFKDYTNFIRSFTKIVGISPGKYRLSSLL